MMLQTYTLQRISIPNISFIHRITTARSKVKSRSHHDVAHLQPPTNDHNMYQLPTSFTVSEINPEQGQGHYSMVKGQIKVIP